MNTNNTLQMDVLDILFANRNKTYGAYQLRRGYNKRLSIAIAAMLLVCLLFTIGYGLGTKTNGTAPVLVTSVLTLENVKPKEPVVVPPPVKEVHIEKPIATIQVTKPILVKEVATPPPTIDDMEGVKIDVVTKDGTKGDFIAPPVEQGTGTVQSLIKKEDYDGEFVTVEQQASFPGGLDAWRRFLQMTLRVDVPAENGAPAGSYTVLVSFLVDKEGKVSEVKADNDPGYGTAAEAVRAIQRGPNWIPAKQNNHSVLYRQRQPVTFIVQQDQ